MNALPSPASQALPRRAPTTPQPQGSLVDAFGGRYYRITDSDRLPPFFMNIVSASDLWLFVASNGGLTAGRVDAENALFSYQTVDRIYDAAGHTGPFTAFWVETATGAMLWQPFTPRTAAHADISRALYKSLEGDRLWFEETHRALGLVFRYGWSTAEEHGFLRRCELENLSDAPVSVRVLDGLRNVLPAGIGLRLQSQSSCLADAYKTAEQLPDSNVAVFALAAAIVDRAIALESLRASVAWSDGLPQPTVLLSDTQLGRFLENQPLAPEPRRRGVRCSYLLESKLALAPHATTRWLIAADIGLSQVEVAARHALARTGQLAPRALAASDVATAKLRELVATADGLQCGGEEVTTAHHFTNVLFNVMRGGVFAHGHEIPGRDFAAFVAQRNRAAAARHDALLAALPASLPCADLLARLAATGDTDLERLGLEYLPLTFSRRHGDPSRPWNKFKIHLRDAHGERLLNYEGNWRDIFQNWEALCLSHPEFLPHVVAKFLNASTADGYNPYRLTNAGLDWEVPDHEDPWSSIGYWGDHQVIYLLKLCEWLGRFSPGQLDTWLRRELFSYANVPYRIADYAAIRRDPRATIHFHDAQNRATLARVSEFGTDARLVADASGAVRHANLTEKLLVLVLTRLTNFVPGGGIWMNTQRPEWNDANNALVGYGVSVVTLSYLRRALVHFQRELLPSLGDAPVAISSAVAQLAQRILATLESSRGLLAHAEFSSADGRALLDALATAGSDYRQAVYANGLGAATPLDAPSIRRLFAVALEFVDHSLRANRRADGLYHAYNLLEFTENPAGLRVQHLGPMLEGQVAILSSGLLSPSETADLLAALRASALFRADQHSYLLYPDRELPGFIERNVIPATLVERSVLLRDLLARGDTRLVQRDASGAVRFHADLANEEALHARLDALARDAAWKNAVEADRAIVAEIYETVFRHRQFTGRSGSMFGYEGLGCIYWHMVAKLLLAVQENAFAADAVGDPVAARLKAAYYEIRAGLGFNKTPAEYGAFPTDPYSHTPGHSGAQQPGMTGQVKEEILTRWGELGVRVERGSLAFRPTLLRASEFTTATATLRWPSPTSGEQLVVVPPRALAFTFCAVPVIYCVTKGETRIRWTDANGVHERAGVALDAATSAEVFARSGRVARIEVELGDEFRPL